MAEDPIQNLHGEVTVLDPVKELNALDIVEEPADPVLLAEPGEAVLTEMPVRDMADIVTECDRLNEILVETEGPANRAGDPRDELDMDDPVGDVIVLDKVEYLGLVDIPGICTGMDNPVGIPRIGGTDILFHPVVPAHCIGADRGMGGQECLLPADERPDCREPAGLQHPLVILHRFHTG